MVAGTPTSAPPSTLAALSRIARAMLTDVGIEESAREAAWILEAALGCTRLTVLLDGGRELSPEEWDCAMTLLRRRAVREPLQYVLGSQEFCGREFAVNHSVLIPRPETEVLVEEVIRHCCRGPAQPVVADLGSGSGCVAVSLALALPRAVVYATDVSAPALEVTRYNARRHDVEDRVTCLEGDLLGPLAQVGLLEQVDVVASNPPYIAERELATLQPEVRLFEPRVALDGGADGLAVHRRLVADAVHVLKPGGMLVVEVGDGQAGCVKQLALESGFFHHIRTVRDAAGVERVVSLQRPA